MTGKNIFVDTSAWVAVSNKNDCYYEKAVSVYPSVLKQFHCLYTTNLVIAETYTILLKEMGHKYGLKFINIVRSSSKIFKTYSDEAIEQEAETILQKYSDQKFSYTDAVSFALMKKFEIKKAFSFDKHFWAMGFENILDNC